MPSKSCFVVMPILKTGTPDNQHFKAIFNNIKAPLEGLGYQVVRADDVQKGGAITKDIVTRLAESDLVIADLTDVNPNVMYELGIRHALRGKGTLMILDEKRTPEIPFDLSAYRVIKFSGDLTGIDSLSQAIIQFIDEDETGEDGEHTDRDNPVHDWFPTLPLNVLETAEESSEAPLRKAISDLQAKLALYEKAYGKELAGIKSEKSPLATVLAALNDAEDGLVPATIMDDLRQALESRNVVAFLQKLRLIIERNVRLPSTMYIVISSWATMLDMDAVVKSIYDLALFYYPSDTNVKMHYLGVLAHSDSPADREIAREELPKLMSFDVSDGRIAFSGPERSQRAIDLLGTLLDAHQKDELYDDELRIAELFVSEFPDRSIVIRNYARALLNNGRSTEAMEHYREALFAPDVDDTSAIWFGNELHNQRRNRDAAEAYAFAACLDPSDASIFAHLAEEMSHCLNKNVSSRLGTDDDASAPLPFGSEDIVAAVQCAHSCGNIDAEAVQRLRSAMENLDENDIELGPPLPRARRLQIARDVFGGLQTNLTRKATSYEW